MQAPPQVIRTNYHSLPNATKERLQAISATKADRLKINRGYLGGPIWSIIGGAICALVVYFWVFSHDDTYPMRTDDSVWTALVSLLAAGLLVGGLMALLRRRSSPVRSFWYAHPAYLIDCDFEDVTAYPLLHLDNVNLTHHIRNGVYQYTDVAMKFGSIPLSIQYFGKEAAVEFAKVLLGSSDLVRAAAQRGSLQSIPESNLFPADAAPSKGGGSRWLIESGAAGAAGAVIGFALLPAVHDVISDDNAFYNCGITNEREQDYRFYMYSSYGYGPGESKFTNDIERTCRAYLENYPSGNHTAEADDKLFSFATISIVKLEEYRRFLPNGRNIGNIKAAIRALYDQAEAKYRETAKPQVNPQVAQRATPELASQGIEAMAQVIQALRDNENSKVYIKYTRAVDFNDKDKVGRLTADQVKAKNGKGLVFAPIEPAFTDKLNQDRESGITAALTETYRAIIPEEIMSFEAVAEGALPPADAAVVFDINYVVFPAPYFFSAPDSTTVHHDIVFDWTFTISFPKSPALKPYQLKIQSIPANTVSPGYEMYDSLVRSCFADFGSHLKGTFGFEAVFNVASPKMDSVPGLSLPPLP